jgi:lambda repressor-like predicted transcriptional regulator
MKTTQADMRPTEIRIAMMQAGVNQSAIARELGVSHTAVRLIIDGKGVSHRIREKIAEQIGIDIRRIWPSTYMFDGPRKVGRPWGAINRRKAAA